MCVYAYDIADTIKLPKIDIFLISECGQNILTGLIMILLQVCSLFFFIIKVYNAIERFSHFKLCMAFVFTMRMLHVEVGPIL